MQIEISAGNQPTIECMAVILVPEIALTEPGHIRTFAANQTAQSKHEFYALGQMALIQFEDGELMPRQITDPVDVKADEETVRIDAGIVICRTLSGELAVISNTDNRPRKYLETANRFCTRWIRLDI
ncbi:MAG: hypothetical protein GY795_03565 [Desulfobacterales bacterium]|nr:hypothetical protein [Desulfobacterales bacterium]